MKLSSRAVLFAIIFTVLSGVLAYASTVQLSPQDAQNLTTQVQGLQPTTDGIFINNVRVALIEFIPFVGPAFGVYVSYSTGVVIAAIAETSTTAHISGLESFFILLITPIYWMEFFSYSLAVEESIALVVSIRRRDFLKTEWKWLLVSIFLVVSVLFLSARIEASLVNFLG
ncbi:MAG: stage II sporulation protein M [Nitrososphaerales archaeon]